MDPRRPEEAVYRIDQLIGQFKGVLDKIRTEPFASRLSESEREGALVVQEICLVAPRLHEAMMQASRTRRAAIAKGIVEGYVEKSEEPQQAETVIAEPKEEKPKPKKKTTRKKKTTEKADK